MTLYIIYKKTEGLNPIMYAFTNKKYILESFIEERRMSMFEVREKDITKEDYKLFSAKFHSHILGRRGFETSPSPSDLLSKRKIVYVTATEYEEMDVIIKVDHVIAEIGKKISMNVRCFNNKMLDALNTLHYFEIYKFANPDDMDPFVDGVIPFRISDNSNGYRIDSLYLFIYLYGNTLSTKGDSKNEQRKNDEW